MAQRKSRGSRCSCDSLQLQSPRDRVSARHWLSALHSLGESARQRAGAMEESNGCALSSTLCRLPDYGDRAQVGQGEISLPPPWKNKGDFEILGASSIMQAGSASPKPM